MDCTPLGHAGWLIEVEGLRLLFDPLLTDRHHGGVFGVVPPRRVHAEALRPDFLFISHRHTDHFDVRSLVTLARLDPDTVVVTPDDLVATIALRAGFHVVRSVPPRTRVELDRVSFVTTDSLANEQSYDGSMECGFAVGDLQGAVVWNQVDSIHATPAAVRDSASEIERALAAPISLAMVRWAPLLEIDATTAGNLGFPYRAYFELLEQVAAVPARAIVPSSAGARHLAPWEGLNRLVYPVDEQRFLRDLRARQPSVNALVPTLGGIFHVSPTSVDYEPSAATHYVTSAHEYEDDRRYHPLEVPSLTDPYTGQTARLRSKVDAWVHHELREAIARDPSYSGARRRLCLEVVYSDTTDVYAIETSAEVSVVRGECDWDLLNAVAGSQLAGVIDGVRAWGDVLLAGALRCATRAYDVDARGARRANLPPVFLYSAISYRASLERAVESELQACLQEPTRSLG